jgi:CheY-like chemotaxis protein
MKEPGMNIYGNQSDFPARDGSLLHGLDSNNARTRVTRKSGKILVIDDSPSARAVICSMLSEWGYEVFELSSSIGATRIIVRNEIDAAIVDVSMPGLSGDKLVGVLRENPKLEGLVILVISGRDPEQLEAIGRTLPVDGVLAKRELHERLLPTLSRLMFRRRTGIQLTSA